MNEQRTSRRFSKHPAVRLRIAAGTRIAVAALAIGVNPAYAGEVRTVAVDCTKDITKQVELKPDEKVARFTFYRCYCLEDPKRISLRVDTHFMDVSQGNVYLGEGLDTLFRDWIEVIELEVPAGETRKRAIYCYPKDKVHDIQGRIREKRYKEE